VTRLTPMPRGKVAIIGAGPAGMAAALSVHQAGHDVVLLERYAEARAAGNILNLWPPPIKALGLLGVDTEDLGSPCDSEFSRNDSSVRALIRLPADVKRDYGGGFIGLLRPELYERLLAALPPGVLKVNSGVTSFEQDESGVRLHMADGSTVECDVLIGADGIDSVVRSTLWGAAPKREHNLHIFGGFVFDENVNAELGRCVVMHNKVTQGSWTSIRNKGRDGYQWWVLTGHDASQEFTGDLHETATALAADFADPLPQLVALTEPRNVQRWVIRDRKPLKQWSRGRVTIIGDAAHPTSPYAAYGAGMATEDGYFLGRRLAGVDLKDPVAVGEALEAFEGPRKPHTSRQSQQAYVLGQAFHHAPAALRHVRDLVFDHTPILQKVIGDATPGEILKQIDEIDRAEERFTALHR
jgi:2-polyprenyl-6-methoxyphenol hydroxylase-like FAD-dependent oxidoreductase